MRAAREQLLSDLAGIVSSTRDRIIPLSRKAHNDQGLTAPPEGCMHSPLFGGAESVFCALQSIADVIRSFGNYRWVGLYEIEQLAGVVTNIVWSGQGAPEYPAFPVTKGLTGVAIAERRIVNIGDVSADPRYLTAFHSTRSEIIVPIFDREGNTMSGTIDVESQTPNAFDRDAENVLRACSEAIRPLWDLELSY